MEQVPPSNWLSARSHNGGIDRVPLPIPTGALWLAGKHMVGPDHRAAMAGVGASLMVCLTQAHELADRYPRYLAWLGEPSNQQAVWLPVPDLGVPAADDLHQLIDQLVQQLRDDRSIIVHCAAGFGRTGTIATCVLTSLGLPTELALSRVAASRPMAGPEVGEQHEMVRSYADYVARRI